ncbi:MAG TPA: hypothetical protein VFM85_07595 [Actinomycetota bacterium]|nr:hypothetical protein [Actinomycetota bacterium]
MGAERAYVGLKEVFALEVGSLARALEEMKAADALAGIPVEVLRGPDVSTSRATGSSRDKPCPRPGVAIMGNLVGVVRAAARKPARRRT